MKKRILYFQSGGPTPVINATLAGLLREGKRHDDIEILGAKNGIEGLLDEDFHYLSDLSAPEIDLLSRTPGMALGSSRKNLPEDEEDPLYRAVIEILERNGIGGLFINGGNDSMLTAKRLDEAFKKAGKAIQVIGLPKTIDNDLLESDHTLGYPSAALHVLNVTKAIALDASIFRKGKVQLIETMGRDTGWLAAASDLLPEPYRPDLILLPERPFSQEDILKKIQALYERKGHAVVVLAEGVNPDVSSLADPFGHLNFEGAADHWAKLLDEKLGIPSRTNVLSTYSREDPYSLSAVDYREAIMAGSTALKAYLSGLGGVFLSLKRLGTRLYDSTFRLVPLQEVAGKVRYLPKSFLLDETRMSDAFRDYLRPLLERIEPDVGDSGVFRAYTLKMEGEKA